MGRSAWSMPDQASQLASVKLRFCFYSLILLGLCVYSALVGPQQITTVRAVQKNPASFHGRELRLSSQIRVSQLLDDGFLIEQRRAKMHVRVLGKAPSFLEKEKSSLKVGDLVSLRGRWQGEGYLLLEELHIQEMRPGRILVSSLTVLALLILLLHRGKTLLFQNA
jgi:hypothetical protein